MAAVFNPCPHLPRGDRSDLKDHYLNYPLREARRNALRSDRETPGYTGKEVADLIGVTGIAYNRYERLRACPMPERQVKIAKLFNCKKRDIFPEKIHELVRFIRNIRIQVPSEDALEIAERLDYRELDSYELESLATTKGWIYFGNYESDFEVGRLAEALQELPLENRRVIELRHRLDESQDKDLNERSFREIGTLIGKTHSTALDRYNIGLKKLKLRFGTN
jgi:DNA-binding XRE family transcriptional regulator